MRPSASRTARLRPGDASHGRDTDTLLGEQGIRAGSVEDFEPVVALEDDVVEVLRFLLCALFILWADGRDLHHVVAPLANACKAGLDPLDRHRLSGH